MTHAYQQLCKWTAGSTAVILRRGYISDTKRNLQIFYKQMAGCNVAILPYKTDLNYPCPFYLEKHLRGSAKKVQWESMIEKE